MKKILTFFIYVFCFLVIFESTYKLKFFKNINVIKNLNLSTSFLFSNQKFVDYFQKFGILEYCFVVDDKGSFNNEKNLKAVVCGDKIFGYTSEVKDNFLRCEIVEISLGSEGDYLLNELFEDGAFVVSNYFVEGIEVYNLYSGLFARFVILSDKKTNIQVAIGKNFVKVGYPCIYTSY